MNRVILTVACLLLALPAATLAQSEPRDAVEYRLELACPSSTNGLCPIQAWDSSDALGAPAIAVDPDDVNNMIIASLHNGHNTDGPEARSRGPSQPFTTHTSTNHGASWLDNPYSPPTDIPFGASGEHPGIALDPYGHVFISSLYSIPADASGGEWRYVIAAQKFSSLQDINTNQNGAYNVDYIDSVELGARIGQTWFVYDPLSEHVVLLWNEQHVELGAQDATEPENTTVTGDPAADALIAGARRAAEDLIDPEGPGPQASAQAPSDEGLPRGAIGWVWTTAEVAEPYRSAPTSVIEPCASSTNPVVSEGWLYVGCIVGDGDAPTWAADALPGEVHMFRFLPQGGAPQYIGPAPVSGGAPKIGVRSDGRMAILTTEVVPAGNLTRIRLDGAYGQYDPKSGKVEWSDVHEYGEELAIIYANMPVVRTNIQDLIYREYSGVIHLIFKRVADWPSDTSSYRPEYYKAIIAIDEHYGLLAEFDLRIGDQAHRQKDGTLASWPASLYDDLSDDFLELPPEPFEYEGRPLGDHYQREFYAVGNYGLIDFAEVLEITELRGPATAGLPNPPPPPNPAPATSSSLALGLAGSLTASSIVAVTAASNKRKSTVRAGRKKK